MKPFPDIWTDGTVASFWLQGYLVQVPIKLGSNDNRAHVIRWLHHQWPFRVKVGARGPRLVKADRKTEIQLHKVYSELVHGDVFVVEATDGNLLRWTPGNIGPRRKPEKIVPPGSQANEVKNQMYQREQEGTLKRYIRQQAQLVKASDGVLTPGQLTEAQTKAALQAEKWERELAALRTREDADADRQQNNEYQMTDPELVSDGVQERPARSSRKPDMDAVGIDSKLQAIYDEHVIHEFHGDEQRIQIALRQILADKTGLLEETLSQFRSKLGGRDRQDPGTERVLNFYGWYSPENGHLPVYEGRITDKPWPCAVTFTNISTLPAEPGRGFKVSPLESVQTVRVQICEGQAEKMTTICASATPGLQSVITRD